MKILIILFCLVVLSFGQYSVEFQSDDSDYIEDVFDYDYTGDTRGCISAWVYFDAVDAYQTVFNWGYTAQATYLTMGIMSINNIWIQGAINGGGVRGVRGNTTLETGQWYHMVWWADDQTGVWRLYLNGERETLTVTNTANSGYWFDTMNLCDVIDIGAKMSNSAYSAYLDGKIAGVASFSDTLSDAEVLEIYNNGYRFDLTGYDHLQDWWKFDEGTGTTVADAAGYRGVDFDFFNTPAWSESIPGWSGAIRYVDPGGDNTKPGNDPMYAWADFDSIAKVSAGDTIAIRNLGSDYPVRDKLTLPDDSIYVTTYDSATGVFGAEAVALGDYGTITLRDTIPGWSVSGNWTDLTGDKWAIDFAQNPYRVFLDTTEYYMAQSVGGITSTLRWYWTSNVLSVYATENPSTLYSSVEAAGGEHWNDWTIDISAKKNITLDNIDVQGGWPAIRIYGGAGTYCSDITIQNCNIGRYSWSGIYFYSVDSSASNITIANNTFASGANYTGYTWQYPNIHDGITGAGIKNSSIYGNTITDWGHTGISISSSTDTSYVSNANLIYGNTISGTNIGYMRAFSLIGYGEDLCRDNQIYGNLCYDLTHRNQIAGNNNKVMYNIIYGITQYSGAGAGNGSAQGIELSNVGATNVVCHNNLIANNVIYNTEEAGIRIRALADADTIENNDISNNIFHTNGTSSLDGYTDIGVVVDAGNIGSNTFNNNNIYNSGTSLTVSWETEPISVSDFNAMESSNNNIGNDPLFTTAGSDFTLQSGSPCINAGVDVGLTTDYEGNSIIGLPDIGAYEFQGGAQRSFRKRNLYPKYRGF